MVSRIPTRGIESEKLDNDLLALGYRESQQGELKESPAAPGLYILTLESQQGELKVSMLNSIDIILNVRNPNKGN